MKRIITLVAVAAASLLMAARAHAQFGIVGGITSSTTDMTTAEDVKAMSLYHAGLTYKFNLGGGFAIQPSVLYQVKGACIDKLGEASSEDFKVKTGFVELPLGLQWGPDLLAFRPFVMAEPFIGYKVGSYDRGDETVEEWFERSKNDFEYGFSVGGGVELAGNIQLSVQWFNNMGTMVSDDSSSSSFSDKVKNFKGIKFSLAILFF